MSSAIRLRLLVLLFGAAALTVAYHQSTEEAMVQSAQNFLASLSDEQRAKVNLEFEEQAREEWHFVPDSSFEQTYEHPRPGLTYGQLEPEQRHLADVLLSTGLSEAGLIKAKTIMSLEAVLRDLEGDTTGRRDPQRYYVSVFGEPSADGRWSWRVEGHHVSLHFTLSGGKLIATTPTFFGANPQKVLEGPRKGLRVLAREEDLARKLVQQLSDEQRGETVVAQEAYRDILTSADTRAKLEDQPTGLTAAEMETAEYDLLMELIAEYAHNVPAEYAAKRMEQAKNTAKEELFFAWAGGLEPGQGHYYRVQAPSFLIEYNNTQNDANHSHTVWRDYDGDFGRDTLAEHLRQFDHGLGVKAD